MAVPKVSFIRSELATVLERYSVIKDCLVGQDAIKKRRTRYLPMPNESDKSDENLIRYRQYVERALFVNVTRRTLNGLVGQVFARDPVSEIPNQLDMIEVDADGGGVTLIQTSKRALNFALSYGRGGCHVDYPNTEGRGATAAEIESGKIRPTINIIAPMFVINWRVRSEGAKKLLSLVVIAEEWPYNDDGFEIKTACQFKVLELTEQGTYKITVYRESTPTNWTIDAGLPKNKTFLFAEEFNPTDHAGRPFDEIPFMIFGCENNDEAVDNPPLYDMAVINIAHYRNSADYEESLFTVGQPTYAVAGIDENWAKEVMKGQINAGSRGGIMLPVGGTAQILQPQPNTQAKEGMEHKEALMIAIGAKFVELSVGSKKTATEAQQEETSETSFLATTANNITAVMEWALRWCARYMNIDASTIKYTLNTDFDITKLSPEARAQLVKEWQAGLLTFSETRNALRKSGIATEDDEVAKSAIASEQAEQLSKMVDEQKALTVPDPNAKIPPAKPE